MTKKFYRLGKDPDVLVGSFTPDELKELKRRATEDYRTVPSMLRVIIKDYFDGKETKADVQGNS